MGTDGDPANVLARETPLVLIGLDCDRITREPHEAPSGGDPGLVLYLKPIVDIDSKREVLERGKDLGRALRLYQEDYANRDRSRSTHYRRPIIAQRGWPLAFADII